MAKEKIIVFVGKASEPPMKLINGNKIIELPDALEQRKGFTHEDAPFLLEHYRRFYKQKVSKGRKK